MRGFSVLEVERQKTTGRLTFKASTPNKIPKPNVLFVSQAAGYPAQPITMQEENFGTSTPAKFAKSSSNSTERSSLRKTVNRLGNGLSETWNSQPNSMNLTKKD
jgi:hypothetical protein